MREYGPQLPATLQAELRDYQEEGFLWLARLARLEAGACLADDMGLGKTVQAIALMLHRAAEGPAWWWRRRRSLRTGWRRCCASRPR